MELAILPINAQLFAHDRVAKRLTAEHSDLGSPPLRNRLYDDACDEGIALFNHKLHSNTRWYLDREERDAEGDVTHWVYLPAPETFHRTPAVRGYTLEIFND